MAINNCSAYKAVQSLQEKNYFSFSPDPNLPNVSILEAMGIIHVKNIIHPALIEYLLSRAIPLAIANAYCREIHLQYRGKEFFSIGLKNHLGGWELRNKYFKGSCSPKSYSYFKKGFNRLLVTEGMFDLLSLATMEEALVKSSDCLILNSLSFKNKALVHLSDYEQIYTYLDNDLAGDEATTTLIKHCNQIIDNRGSYRKFKDLNELLRSSF